MRRWGDTMARCISSLLWLACIALALGSSLAPDRALAQVTEPLVKCPELAQPTAGEILRIQYTAAGGCEANTATEAEYLDPETATSSDILFQLFTPGDTRAVKILMRDASGTALNITSLVCGVDNQFTGQTSTIGGIGSTVGTIEVPDAHICTLYALWENGDDTVSFAGGVLDRTNQFTRLRLSNSNSNDIVLAGGPFGSNVATTDQTSAILQRNDIVINDGDTDDVGTLTPGAPVTVTYTVNNFGGRFVTIAVAEDDRYTRNITSYTFDPPHPRRSFETDTLTLPIGGSLTFSITFTPSHPTDFELHLELRRNDVASVWSIVGSITSDDDDEVTDRTRRIIKNFMGRRAGLIVGQEPDLTGRLGRPAPQAQSLKDAPPLKLGGPVNVTGEGTEHNNRLAFSTSLGQVVGSMRAAKQRRVGNTTAARKALGNQGRSGSRDDTGNDKGDAIGDPMGLGYDLVPQPQTRFGLWAQGTWARVDDDTAKSDFGLLYVGADYRFRDGLVVGVIAQFDRTDEEDDTNDFSIEGKGWMVGPYIVARLRPNLIFDARAAWGKSDNEVSPYNTYTDDFDGRRWLVRGRLTGDFNFGRLHIAPHIGVVYFKEEQKAYVDSNGYTIGAQTVELGRLTFGPKFSTSFTRADGTTIAPFVAINGIWDFKRTDQVDIDTGFAVTGSDKFRARTEAGLSIRLPQGVAITGEGFYDGIGANGFNAYGGSVKVGVPF